MGVCAFSFLHEPGFANMTPTFHWRDYVLQRMDTYKYTVNRHELNEYSHITGSGRLSDRERANAILNLWEIRRIRVGENCRQSKLWRMAN